MKHIKHWKRWLLAACALAVGGGLGSVLLADPDPVKSLAFLAACTLLGEGFCRLDRKWQAQGAPDRPEKPGRDPL